MQALGEVLPNFRMSINGASTILQQDQLCTDNFPPQTLYFEVYYHLANDPIGACRSLVYLVTHQTLSFSAEIARLMSYQSMAQAALCLACAQSDRLSISQQLVHRISGLNVAPGQQLHPHCPRRCNVRDPTRQRPLLRIARLCAYKVSASWTWASR